MQQGTVQRINDFLPSEDEASLGLNHAQLVPINGGTELLLYGGWQGDYSADIWKYNIEKDTWTQHGSLLTAREEHIVLPVTGLDCSTK
jgi:hypothetical protein